VDIQKSYAVNDKFPAYGTLYLVATPIGNLEDMTIRAIRVLKEVNLIAAEDTRQTRKLLTHFEISTKMVSYHTHNLRKSGEELIEALQTGKNVALVSDAGLPNISDPGFELVQQAIAEHIHVVPIPGANAALTALIVSGISTNRFQFIGFLPKDKKSCLQELENIKHTRDTMLFYESPHRLEKTLNNMKQSWGGERHICIARELTKKFEEFVRGSLSECLEHVQQHQLKGEFCIVASGYEGEVVDRNESWWQDVSVDDHVQAYVTAGESKKDAIKKVAQDRHLSKRDIYQTQINK
jgi:16S rRNA (cytidine1402-2'-O)-methyltransferase